MKSKLRHLRPTPLGLHITGVLVLTVSMVGAFYWGLLQLEDVTRDARDHAEAQSYASAVVGDIDAATLMVIEGREQSSAGIAGQPSATSWAISPVTAANLAVSLRELEATAGKLHDIHQDEESLLVLQGAIASRGSFTNYLEAPTETGFRMFQAGLEDLRFRSSALQPQIDQESAAVETHSLWMTSLARTFVVFGSGIASIGTCLVIWVGGRRLNQSLVQSTREKAALIESTAMMHRRNQQFQSLYQVVSEVSETLSLQYVVQTTIREARTLVSADVSVLRLLKDGRLGVVGTAQDVDADVASLGDVQLGVGLVGRAARRGKSLRVDEDAEASMDANERILGVQSGVIVPLIVGARVVGTLTCWSRKPNLFSADDEQVLEMMGSQVATAVVAASTHEASEHEAHHDALTGVPNRRQLNRDIVERFHPALLSGRPVSITMVDIDHFKRFNDEFGHKIGDVTLQKVAQVLINTIRAVDSVYRYGGEEFTIVFEDTTPEEAMALMDRVRNAVAQMPLTGNDGEPVGPVTISAGIAGGRDLGLDCEALIKLADDALYQSKWSGRNRVTIYDDTIRDIPSLAA